MVNKNKVSFIYCTNNEAFLEESIRYVNKLDIPDGMEIEILTIRNANSITSAYNEAMQSSDAKYKVYLHQDVFLINPHFIKEVVDIFNENENIGMLGTVGADILPTNGIWWESEHKYGKVYENHTGEMKLLEFNKVEEVYKPVQAIDGLIMITQYDIPWREDLFDGWHFYDISQSIEFKRAGYEVVVPRQEEVWCVHDCGFVNFKNGYEVYREKFLDEYSKDIYPLVSILIPTYNRPDYFREALESVLNQTYRNIEVIIGDDSTNMETNNLVQYYLIQNKNIYYYHNEENLGQFDNDLKLFQLANGEFINFLMDDDLFEKQKIEKMMNYFLYDNKKEINIVTSHRGIIDESGEYKGIFGNVNKSINKTLVMNGTLAGDTLISTHENFIGEPTTVLFRKNSLEEPFGVFNGRKYGPNIDQATWLNLLSKGDLVYINEVLSYFRLHKGQQQNNPNLEFEGCIDHMHKLLTCRSKNFLSITDDFNKALSRCVSQTENTINRLEEQNFNINEHSDSKTFYNYYNDLLELNKKHKIKGGNLAKIKKSNLPLVSILIPTYNQTHFLKEALESAINQTYPNIEIIIGDDSTNDEVEEFLQPYLRKYDHIFYFRNEREVMDYGVSNINNLLNRSKGEYINFLNHDDVLHINKIKKMVDYLISLNDVALVTSHRQLIDKNGSFLSDNEATKCIFSEDTLVNGEELTKLCLENMTNFIGEPTTILFKKSLLNKGELGQFLNKKYFNLSDFATWLTLLQRGNAVYITETLSYFRQHNNQNTFNKNIFYSGIVEWKKMIDQGHNYGLIEDPAKYINLIYKWFYTFKNIFETNNFDVEDATLNNELLESFRSALDIIERQENNHLCVICEKNVRNFLPYPIEITEHIQKLDIIGSDVNNHACPHCNCHDRERHIYLFFNKLDYWTKIRDKKILHVAPEYYVSKVIKNYNPKEYICADLYPTNNKVEKMDITSINYGDNYFDMIICNHVLEHIPNDIKAMRELYRVLKVGGQAILQTPYSPVLEESYEDETIDSPEKRLKFYGQEDHVRVYGLDFFKRLELVGFKLNVIKNSDLFTLEESKYFGVNHKEDLILVTK